MDPARILARTARGVRVAQGAPRACVGEPDGMDDPGAPDSRVAAGQRRGPPAAELAAPVDVAQANLQSKRVG